MTGDFDLSQIGARVSQLAPAKPFPNTFLGFCEWMNVTLHPGQRVLCAVAYDGVDPQDLPEPDRKVAVDIFGDVQTFPKKARGVLNAVCGGRGGKSYILIALRLIYGMYTRDLKSLAPGQRAVALIVSPNALLRQEVVNYALGAIRSKPELRATLLLPKNKKDEDVVTEFMIRRKDGHIVKFEAGVATRGGYGGRGRSLTDFAMDECAFFRDASFQVNDADIFKAASPRVLPGGMSIAASTPWAEKGILYDFFKRNHGKPVDAMSAHAPTTTLNPTPWAADIVAREYERDPDNAAREYGARFMTGGTTIFFEPSTLEASIDHSISLPRKPLPGERVSAGGDFGFRSDSSALVIAHDGKEVVKVEGQKDTYIPVLRVGAVLELRPEKGIPLKPSQTVKEFAVAMREQGATYVVADQHYRESIDEHLVAEGLAYCPAPTVPAVAYMRVRALLRQGRVRLPDHARLLQQLKEIQGRPLPGGGMSILSPRWKTGGHGDIAAAFVLALFDLGGEEVPVPKEVGSRAWEEEQRAARRKVCQEAQTDKPWWKARGARPNTRR